jgi:hypothetical protein
MNFQDGLHGNDIEQLKYTQLKWDTKHVLNNMEDIFLWSKWYLEYKVGYSLATEYMNSYTRLPKH